MKADFDTKRLEQADARSLVLLDELGAGTDPQEGSALARAILAHLVEQRITSLVATHYPELRTRPDTVRHLILQWHESIGVSLLHALDFAEDVVNAIADHDRLRASPPKGLRSLGDVVYVANALAGAHFEWTGLDLSAPTLADLGLEERYGELRPAIESEAQALLATLT